MSAKQEGPYFNLKAVVQQTGLKPDTLRAWERRYGLPQPKRSSGRHRLYSRRDIETVKWLVARQQEGLSIKRAVQLWRQIEAEGRDPLVAVTTITPLTAPAPEARPVGETLVQLREDWIAACLDYDEQRAEQAVAEAFALYSPETVCLKLLQRAMAQIGEGWYQGVVTVQQEHFCSALAIRRLEALVMAAPPPTRPGRILAACPPREEHVFGLLLVTFLLRRRGWDVVYLGANVPAERLETTIAATRPHLVLLAAQQLHSAATLLATAQLVHREGVPVAYGGLIFNLQPALRARLPGHFLGEHLEMAPRMVEILMTAPRPVSAVEPVPEAYHQAQDHYRERLGAIEASLNQTLSRTDLVPGYLSIANRELALNIDAALALGDMRYLGTGIDWARGLLSNYRLPADALGGYLASYYQAVQDNLDERGEPIVTWLAKIVHESQLV
jgi:DNA-binding transcriptional MerR regulator/methylmalonyl-CoA mutase cobalamin-binding subunit